MSQLPPPGELPSDGPATPAPSASMVRRRAASVQLRNADSSARPEDQANQALGDALRVVYRFLQVGMLILVGVFLLSGFQSVKEGERGMRVTMGRVTDDDLRPGFQWSAPRPVGEIVKIDIGNKTLDIRDEFWPNQAGEGKKFAEDRELATTGRGKLDPVQDGMLLLGDLSIAHATAKVEYVRQPERVREFARNIHPSAERPIIRAAVMQAIVRAAAGRTIDEFRKSLEMQRQAHAFAQQILDNMNSGLEIKSLVLDRRLVPVNLITVFNQMDTAIATSEEQRNKASQTRQATLAAVAGDAAEDLLALIDRYDAQLTAGQTDESEQTLAQIDRLLDGQPVAEGGHRPGARATGDVARLLSDARTERARAVERAQASAQAFAAKYETFTTNPALVLMSDWTTATSAFRGRDSVQAFLVPPGTRTLELAVNRDPTVQKEQDRKRNQEDTARREAEELEKAKATGRVR